MKIEVAEDYTIMLKEVFSGVCLEQPDGNRIGICMRDNTFEISVMPKGLDGVCEPKGIKHFRVNMESISIEKMG